jgi:membrane-associated phospholipid phosphatase
MPGDFDWETAFIIWVQSFRNSFLDGLFFSLSFMGTEGFYLLFLPVIYWCVSRDAGLRLGVIFLLNDYLNGVLKDALGLPRPDDPRITVLWKESSPGFPSGHAQSAVVLWGYLAARFRRPVLWVLAVMLPLAVGFSRIYLGVHYPRDVVGGWLIGLAFLLLSLAGQRTLERLRLPPGAAPVVAAGIALVLLVFAPGDGALRDMAVLVGLGLGAAGESSWVGFDTRGKPGRQVAKLAVGLALLFTLWLGLKVLLPATPEFRFLRYAAVGLWVALGAPWLFVRFGLARKRPASGRS